MAVAWNQLPTSRLHRTAPVSLARVLGAAAARVVPVLVAPVLVIPVPLGAALPAGEARWPLEPRPQVAAPFTEPTHRYGPGHRGADLLGLSGQVVVAPVAGSVRFVGQVAGVPVLSLVHPDGRRTTYQPLVSPLSVGDPVAAGEPLGTLVGIGSHCAPLACLHWGLYDPVTARHLDPLTWVAGRHVRLLPLHD